MCKTNNRKISQDTNNTILASIKSLDLIVTGKDNKLKH